MPITATIIVVLFRLQRVGTARVGRLFGPVMVVWFIAIGACGVAGIVDHPEILKSLSPTYAIGFLINHFSVAFFALAAVVLAITGAEALYADMGHFGRRPITRAWLILVFPACILSYMGQGALILADPQTNISSPFFLLVPGWARVPMLLLATAATVIASQAVITGAFSVSHQAAQLGYLPRMRINHTSAQTIGQIYVPWINWTLMVSVLALVFVFRSSAALAFAFGMAVTGTIIITTLLFFYIVRHRWGKPLWLVVLGAGAFLTVDVLFFAANLTKFAHGAWLPLLIGLIAFTVMTTWQRGRGLVTAQREQDEGPLQAFIDQLHDRRPPLPRIPGTAVFLNRGKATAPLAMRANVQHNKPPRARRDPVARDAPIPHVPDDQRIVLDDLGYTDDGITHVTCGTATWTNPTSRTAPPPSSRDLNPARTGRRVLLPFHHRPHAADAPGMTRWRKRLFIATVPDHRRRRRVLPPPPRPNRHHRARASRSSDAVRPRPLGTHRSMAMGYRAWSVPRQDPARHPLHGPRARRSSPRARCDH